MGSQIHGDQIIPLTLKAEDLVFTPNGDIVATTVQDAIVEVRDDADTKLLGKQDTSEKGVALGYASLDAGGKVPVSQLPAALVGAVNYIGAWDAATNSPALASGVGTKGDYYVVSVPGATLIDGISDWEITDWLVFNGTIWQKIDNTDKVASVFGRTGVIVAVSGDYSAGQVTFTSDGDIAAVTVQAAIVEVRDDTDTKLTSKASTSHAATHITSGSDEIDGDQLDIDFTPTNYTPTTAPGEVTDLDHLTAHLAGIDTVLASVALVSSVFTRTGDVVAATSDYDAVQVDFTPAGDIAATNVQAAIVEVRDDTDTKLSGKANTSHTHTLVDITDSGALAALDTVGTTEIDADAVTNAKLRESAPLSVIGNFGNVTANPADIVAGTDKHLLFRSGTTIGFGTYLHSDLSTIGADDHHAEDHASRHSDGGADQVFVNVLAEAAAPTNDTSRALRPDGAGGVAFVDVDHADLTGVGIDDHHARDHAATHITAGADEIDGDQLDIDFTPTNYTPTTVPAEVTSLDHLTAHLAGIDTVLAGIAHPITSVFGRTGIVVAVAGDYTASEVTFAANGDITSVTVQAAIVELRNDTDTKLLGYSLTSHTHAHSAITGIGTDDHHAESHTIASHSDTTATGTELNTLTDGSNADVLHTHAHSATTGQGIDDHHARDHAATHILAGADEVDGDQIGIDYTPVNYVPTTSPAEATSLDHLTAHLAGLDEAVSIVRRVSTTNATVTAVYTFAIPADTTVVIMADIAGSRTNGAGRLGHRRRAMVHREGAAAAAFQGGINTPMSKTGGGDSGSWDATFDLSSNTLRVIVTGFAANDIEWTARISLTVAS